MKLNEQSGDGVGIADTQVAEILMWVLFGAIHICFTISRCIFDETSNHMPLQCVRRIIGFDSSNGYGLVLPASSVCVLDSRHTSCRVSSIIRLLTINLKSPGGPQLPLLTDYLLIKYVYITGNPVPPVAAPLVSFVGCKKLI